MTGAGQFNLKGEPLSSQGFSNTDRRFYNDDTEPYNPYGITVLSEPVDVAPTADFISVHGLAGKSMYSWSMKNKVDRFAQFWLLKWLPNESFLQTARISTFGYYSTIDLGSPKSTLNVATFAK